MQDHWTNQFVVKALMLSLLATTPTRGMAAETTIKDDQTPEARMPRSLTITIQPGVWGNASTQDVHAVLKSAAQEIQRHCPNTRIPAIRVYHSQGSPIAQFEREKDGAVRVGLNAQNLYWAQYAYQFSHEFAHLLAVHAGDTGKKWKNAQHANQWFEEALAECASLFALRAMARTWTTNAPYPNWTSFAPKLRDYTDNLLSNPERLLPKEMTLPEWFEANESSLRSNAVQREKNAVVAAQLLPLFEDTPRHWESLAWLNLGSRDPQKSFWKYLQEWVEASPAAHRPFIRRIAEQFGLKL